MVCVDEDFEQKEANILSLNWSHSNSHNVDDMTDFQRFSTISTKKPPSQSVRFILASNRKCKCFLVSACNQRLTMLFLVWINGRLLFYWSSIYDIVSKRCTMVDVSFGCKWTISKMEISSFRFVSIWIMVNENGKQKHGLQSLFSGYDPYALCNEDVPCQETTAITSTETLRHIEQCMWVVKTVMLNVSLFCCFFCFVIPSGILVWAHEQRAHPFEIWTKNAQTLNH